MRHLLFLFILFFTILSVNSYGQIFVANSCDSTILTKEEFKKCLADTALNADIILATNYITNLKTDLLPKYRNLRRELRLSNELQNSLRQLKATYDTVLNTKLSTFLIEMDKNQKYVQPKAYLSSLLSLQTFKFYPDIYAILLNDIHLQLSPKTSISNLNIYIKLVDKISKSIHPDLYKRLDVITTSVLSDNDKLKNSGFSPLFQGSQNQEEKRKYQIINFLLWAE
ncbi:hypothetical protein HY58_08400 [Flavihumibacter sp. ZG627]|nr:hypothetical protein HY58_08400 [Flavihumibacter sp. ZG627]